MAHVIDLNGPGHQIFEAVFCAVSDVLAGCGAQVAYTDRQHTTQAALNAVADRLTTGPLVSRAGAAIVAHDVADCQEHLQVRDCHDQRALSVLRLVADLARGEQGATDE